MAIIIDGKAIAERLRNDLAKEVAELAQSNNIPGLAVILVGDDPASRSYVASKDRACQKVGIHSRQIHLPAATREDELLALIDELNRDSAIDGILVQLPLPKHIETAHIIEAIHPDKDVDGFHPYNLGRLASGAPCFQPCTPLGILRLLDETGIDLAGKNVTVVGRSNIVGKPVALMCLARHATVTICHSRTRDLAQQIGRADVVIAAVGQPQMLKGAWFKEGAVIIDVGINRVEGKLVGDVEFESAVQRASAITPVPGGVGPMTIAMLLANTVESRKRSIAARQ